MKHGSSKGGKSKTEVLVVGVDLGDERSHFCVLNEAGEVIERGQAETSEAGLRRVFGERRPVRLAMETGTHSCWASRALKQMGHTVVVANAREVRKISQSTKKNDRHDAEMLARLLRADVKLLSPVEHGDVETQQDLAVLHARDALVRERTALVNTVRGMIKSFGYRLPKGSTGSFARQAALKIPPALRPALGPLLEVIAELTRQIGRYDQGVTDLAERKYPEVALLEQVAGVGTLTALAYVLRLGDKQRFRRSRDVGPFLGLVPRTDQSGQQDRQLRITKAGDGFTRRLLVSSAHYILGPFGPDCDLRRKGLLLAARGGRNAKKRAVVAVARKLAVLLHHLWVTGEVYEPFYQSQSAAVA